MPDWFKAIVILGGYGLAAPAGSLLLRQWPRAHPWVLGGLVFLTGLSINQTVIMLGSIEWYRGVTKGFEFSLLDVAALALLGSGGGEGKGRFLWLPPGTLTWLLYCVCSLLSLAGALESSYVWMSLLKFGKAWLLAWAAANAVRSEDDLQTFLHSLTALLLFQVAVVLKMKFLDGVYQVRGLFEHQNPLAMFSYMAGLPLLACALAERIQWRPAVIWMSGYAAAGLIVVSALSRAALAVFAVGTLAVLIGSLAIRVTRRRILFTSALAVGGFVMLGLTLDTIISRFHDQGNEASGETREVMNLAALAMARQHPCGIGWNNYAKAINPPYPYGDVIDDWERARGHKVDPDYAKGVVESHYYLLLGETGWPGLCAYLLFIGLHLTGALWCGLRHRHQLAGVFLLAVAVAFALTYLHSTLERVLTQTKNLSLWMLLIGVSGRFIRTPPKRDGEIG